MGAPSINMTDVLKAAKANIAANIESGEKVEIAPALIATQYNHIKFTLCPLDIDREYTNATDGSDTIVIPRCTFRVWASIGLIGGADGSFENTVIGFSNDGGESMGVCAALEYVEAIMRDHFLEDSDVRSIKFEYDKPTFTPVDLGNNQAAMAGSFRVTVTGAMSPVPESLLMFGTRTMALKVPLIHNVQINVLSHTSVTITWDTNFPSTSFVIYSIGINSNLALSSIEDETLTTSHSVTLIGLSPATYYELRPCSRDITSTRVGKSHERFNFTTEVAPILLTITNLVFMGIKNGIRLTYDTNVATKCYIYYRVHGGFPFWTSLNFTTLHTGGHIHNISSLINNNLYDIKFQVTDASLNSVWSPSEVSYYTVYAGLGHLGYEDIQYE